MRRSLTSPLPRRPHSRLARVLGGWLSVLALLGGFGVLAPAAGATSSRSIASVTAATTGLPDASLVVPLDACGAPSAIHAACLAKVLGVRGTRSLVHPRLRRPASPFRLSRRASRLTRTASPLAVSAAGAPQPGTPAYLQQAYDLAYLSQTAGAGATIAIVDAFDAPQAEADLAAYRTEFSLPPCTTDNGCFRKVDQNGGVSYPSSTSAGWELETALDLDAVSALCPNCHIVLVEAASNTLPDLAAAQAEAAQLGASVISDSWAVAYSDSWAVAHGEHGAAAAFADSGTYTFPGVTTIAASGDSGYVGTSANNFPAALGDVTAAGGTTLVPAAAVGSDGARGFEESAWSEAGSGCVSYLPKPVWQTDTGCNGRAYTDLSADADPNTGMQVYDSSHDGWLVVGGTSEAAPLIAAYYALLGSVPQSPAWAYANAAQLNDPSAGTNGACWTSLAYICNAGAGYDGPTGAGSISGAVTTGAPGIGGPGASGSYAQGVTADETQLQGGVYPNGADTTYWWEYGTSTAYDQQTPATDIGSGSTPVAVSDSLSGLAPGTTYHYRLVAQNSFGTEYGYDYTLTTTGTPTGSATPGSGPATGPSSAPATGPGTPVPTTPPATSPAPPAGTSGSASGPAAGTASSSQTPPVLGKPRVASAGASSATLTAAVLTSATTTYSIQYGDTPALGHSVTGSIGTSSRSLSGTLRGLAPGHTYYARVVVRDTAGSATSATIRFRTSPVTITRLAIRRGKLVAVLRCHGSAACHVQVKARSGSRLASAGRVTLGGNRSATVALNPGTGRPTTLSVLSSWNGYPAVVSATISRG